MILILKLIYFISINNKEMDSISAVFSNSLSPDSGLRADGKKIFL